MWQGKHHTNRPSRTGLAGRCMPRYNRSLGHPAYVQQLCPTELISKMPLGVCDPNQHVASVAINEMMCISSTFNLHYILGDATKN